MRASVHVREGVLALALALASCRTPVAEAPSRPAGAEGNPARGDFITFYERAAARTAEGGGPNRDVVRHELLGRYKIECSVEMPSGKYFTLARSEDGRAVIFAWTAGGPVRALEKAISATTYSYALRTGPISQSRDWGWLYDRNGDGWVDYFTFVDGAMPVVSDDVAPLVPRKAGLEPGGRIRIESTEELQLMLRSTQLVFTHHADDNFDGRSDAVVASLTYPENPAWFHRSAVLRSRAFTHAIDEDWSFVSQIGTKAGAVPRAEGHLQVSFFDPGDQALETSSRFLDAINEGVRACRIPRGELPRE